MIGKRGLASTFTKLITGMKIIMIGMGHKATFSADGVWFAVLRSWAGLEDAIVKESLFVLVLITSAVFWVYFLPIILNWLCEKCVAYECLTVRLRFKSEA